MKKLLILVAMLLVCSTKVNAMDFTAPSAPESVSEYMPAQTSTFWNDLWYIVQSALPELMPNFTQALRICITLVAIAFFVSISKNLSDTSQKTIVFVGMIAANTVLLEPSKSMIHLGADTIHQLTEYGKLLLPVMTASLAAQGGITTSASLYTGTILFNSALVFCITKIIVPCIYAYLITSIASSVLSTDILTGLCNCIKWLMTWLLKIILYIFTGYIGITGVISGTADAAAVKAAKITLSGVVPVVGGIMSDASEAILVSAGLMKNAAGIYGFLALAAILISPFLKIGVQYLILKTTAAICGVLGSNEISKLVRSFSGAMGIILAAAGSVCLMFLFSIFCYMKGLS